MLIWLLQAFVQPYMLLHHGAFFGGRGEQRRKELGVDKWKGQLGRRAVQGMSSLTSWSRS